MKELLLRKTNNWLKDNGYTLEEEKEIYKENLQDLYDNPQWYLQNLEQLKEYRVSFISYSKKKD